MSQDGEKEKVENTEEVNKDEKAEETAPLVVEKAPSVVKSDKDEKTSKKDKESEASVISDPDMHNLRACCCCMCACSHDRVGDATCFGCLPIKCGILFIAIQIFALSIIMITVTFFQLLNEYLPWWFVFITLLLLIPNILGACFMVYFFGKDNRGTRGRMFGAIILSIISISLWCTWNLIFFLGIYKRDTVYTGMGPANDETNYHATPKRTYLFTVLAETTFILVWLTYYTCVANQYCSLMNDSYDREEKEEDERKKEA